MYELFREQVLSRHESQNSLQQILLYIFTAIEMATKFPWPSQLFWDNLISLLFKPFRSTENQISRLKRMIQQIGITNWCLPLTFSIWIAETPNENVANCNSNFRQSYFSLKFKWASFCDVKTSLMRNVHTNVSQALCIIFLSCYLLLL